MRWRKRSAIVDGKIAHFVASRVQTELLHRGEGTAGPRRCVRAFELRKAEMQGRHSEDEREMRGS